MDSLTLNSSKDFIWQVHRRGHDDLRSSTTPSDSQADKAPVTIEVYNSLLESYEAKKKCVFIYMTTTRMLIAGMYCRHYMPATSKVLSIIDKGVQDRVTKNGETLRRHAESAKRWRILRDRITRTDLEMERVRKILLHSDDSPSENGSSTSVVTSSTRNGYLATPPSISRTPSRTPSATSTISRSISPFRKFARKITGKSPAQPITPLPTAKGISRNPSSEPTQSKARQRQSFLGFRMSQPPTPTTPERGHKYSQSLTPESSPSSRRHDGDLTVKGRPTPPKQRWNSSTKVEPTEDRNMTAKQTISKKTSMSVLYQPQGDIPPVPPLATPYRRSLSRSSVSSSRPWSPFTSSSSTAPTSNPSIAISAPRPSSRAYTPSRPQTPSRSYTPGLANTPRPRPKTPSHIPGPVSHLPSFSAKHSDAGWDDDDNNQRTTVQRAFSPAMSASRSQTPSGSRIPPPRPPSRSRIPLPSLSLYPSRPSSAMSDYVDRPESRASTSFRSSVFRAQTPESTLKAKAQLIPFVNQGSGVSSRSARPSISKLPPSSFRDSPNARTPVTSRPASRTGASTPMLENPLHEYISNNPKDPLDQEVATIVNSIPHGMLIERVDPPLRTVPKAGEEIRAQYAFSNQLSRKVVTCRLTTMTRSSAKTSGQPITTKKVMCRVGGGEFTLLSIF